MVRPGRGGGARAGLHRSGGPGPLPHPGALREGDGAAGAERAGAAGAAAGRGGGGARAVRQHLPGPGGQQPGGVPGRAPGRCGGGGRDHGTGCTPPLTVASGRAPPGKAPPPPSGTCVSPRPAAHPGRPCVGRGGRSRVAPRGASVTQPCFWPVPRAAVPAALPGWPGPPAGTAAHARSLAAIRGRLCSYRQGLEPPTAFPARWEPVLHHSSCLAPPQ